MLETAKKVNDFVVPMIVQIYEIQTPAEAEAMIALNVDHLGSVMVRAQTWKDPVLKQTIEVIQASGRKSSLIPLFCDVDPIVRSIDYYRPDIIHFCEAMTAVDIDNGGISDMLERQRAVRRRFPQVAIMRSIPIGMNGCGQRIPSLRLGLVRILQRLVPDRHGAFQYARRRGR